MSANVIVRYTVLSYTHTHTLASLKIIIRLTNNSLSDSMKHSNFRKEINPEYSLEELMLKLKLQYFGHLMQRADSLEKNLMLGKIEGRRIQG